MDLVGCCSKELEGSVCLCIHGVLVSESAFVGLYFLKLLFNFYGGGGEEGCSHDSDSS